MKATESPLVNLLKGPRQFLIPIYQRAYSWNEGHCQQLWEDVLRVAREDRYPAHFIGSVVYIEHGQYQATTISQLLVIDGQQRLATVTLMIEALARAIESQGASASGEITDRKLRNYFLFNPEEEGDLRYKLRLSRRDADTLRALLDRKALPEEPARHLADNFAFFQEQLEGAMVAPDVLYRGLSKLLVVDVSLDRDHDSPQLIFESLNSTGLDLSQSDLIRNFVLMGLEPAQQEELYEDHWRPMERTLTRGGRDDVFDRFLRAWLTLRLGSVPNIRRGYETFKRYRAMNLERSIAELVADLHLCAEHYACIALGQESHPDLARIFEGLQALRIDAPMPFLMHAYALWKAGTVSDGDMVQIAQLMESWLFRRAVCDIPSNVLSRTFATLPGQLVDKRLLESLAAYLVLRTGRQRCPKDEEFRTALAGRNMYDFKHRQYCLTRLENNGRKEHVDIGDFTVEHVLPQNENLSAEWQTMLGLGWRDVQERWLHTLGNLTLTGYNPELSDRPFLSKRDMKGGFADSPIRLNRSLAKLDRWGPDKIEERGARLAGKAIGIWPGPNIEDEILDEYRSRVAVKAVSGKSYGLDQLGLDDEALTLYEELESSALELGLKRRVLQRYVVFGKTEKARSGVIWIHPRKGSLVADVDVVYSCLEDPPEIASARLASNWKHTRFKLRSRSDVEDCLVVLEEVLGTGEAP